MSFAERNDAWSFRSANVLSTASWMQNILSIQRLYIEGLFSVFKNAYSIKSWFFCIYTQENENAESSVLSRP